MKRLCWIGCVAVLVASAAFAGKVMRGPLPQEQKDIIHYLAEHHAELSRKVTLTDKGYVATTTSNNPDVAEKLKAHFAYMKKRVDSGAMVRRWDPAYVEMVEYHDRLEVELASLENGIKVEVKGKTTEAVKVARNHAKIVSGFVAEGAAAVGREHAPVFKKNADE